jgi:hypothetical protein
MVNTPVVLVLWLLVISNVMSMDASMGEKKTTDYFGVNHHIIDFNNKYDAIVFEDELLKTTIMMNAITPLYTDWQRQLYEFNQGIECSDEEYRKQILMIKEMIQTLKMSYLLESLFALDHQSELLNIKSTCWDVKKIERVCSSNNKQIQSIVKFIQSTSMFSKNHIGKDHSYKSYYGSLKEDLKKNLHHSFLLSRINHRPTSSVDEISDILPQLCHEDWQMLEKVCHGNDSFYALTQQPQFIYQLKNADLFLNLQHISPACLQKMSLNYEQKEIKNNFWTQSLPFLIQEISAHGISSLGRVFQMTFLQSFKPIVSEKKIIVQKELPKKKIHLTVKTNQKILVKKVPEKASAPIIKVEEKLLEPEYILKRDKIFKKSYNDLLSSGNQFVLLDRLAFKYDYVFSPEQLKLLKINLVNFSSFEAIKEMKERDYMGSYQSPIPLSFLKYLIDSGNYTGIYNLINILGENFWVQNNFDLPHDKVFIRIFYDEKIHDWEIMLYPTKGPSQ